MKVFITGATGYLGRELVRQLNLQNEYDIVVVTSNIEKAHDIFKQDNIDIISNTEILERGGVISNSSIIVHGAFSRQSIGSELTQSLKFSRLLFQAAVNAKAKGIINLSSQSVYGSKKESLGDETTELSPGYLYALAKYASEELLKEAIYFSKGETSGCNVRMASLIGPSGEIVPNNIVYKFVCSALSGEPINIVGGDQKFSFLDVRDAAQAIVDILGKSPANWAITYNLGPEKQTGIIELDELVCKMAEEYTGIKSQIEVNSDCNHELNAGMDSSLLYKDLNWKPTYQISDIVKDTIQFAIAAWFNS